MEKTAFKFSGVGAVSYDRYLGPLLFEPAAQILVSSIKNTTAITSVLEVACGTGRVTRQLREYFSDNVQIIATDISADMLQVAQHNLNSDAITFKVEDVQQLSFGDNTFDLVIFQFGLMFLPDKYKGLREVLRVLKPGGTLIASTWDKTENIPLLKLVFNHNILPGFKPEDKSRLLTPFSMHDAAALRQMLLETGFENVAINKENFPSGRATAQDVTNAFFRKHSVGQEVLERDNVAFETMASKMEHNITTQFGNEAVFELSAFFMSGQKGRSSDRHFVACR